MEKTNFVYILGLVAVLFIASCTQKAQIASFEECVAAGNPVMESYPRQCSADGKTFTEKLDEVETNHVCTDEEKEAEACTLEYMPVCGDDGITYGNKCSACASKQINSWVLGECPDEAPNEEEYVPPQPKEFIMCTEEQKLNEMCTREYMPVCGIVDNGVRCIKAPCQSTDAVTYGNKCGACAAKAEGYYTGACEELEFVVCDESEVKTGFSPEKYAADYGGVCVDICPGNYDPYMTQIGITLCIEHYGEKEISGWETCSKSSETCDCVRTYETTQGEQIDDAQYRCVPERYATRLLFRGGQDRLDENGEQSTMIA